METRWISCLGRPMGRTILPVREVDLRSSSMARVGGSHKWWAGNRYLVALHHPRRHKDTAPIAACLLILEGILVQWMRSLRCCRILRAKYVTTQSAGFVPLLTVVCNRGSVVVDHPTKSTSCTCFHNKGTRSGRTYRSNNITCLRTTVWTRCMTVVSRIKVSFQMGWFPACDPPFHPIGFVRSVV